ncbi:MAG: hypothetical protein ACRD4O_07260 [Bryobacteraceae bacterium]
MIHPKEEQLPEAYYDGNAEARRHVEHCSECAARFARLKSFLDSLPAFPVPERGDSYGAEVWTRVLPHLPQPRSGRLRRWMPIPALTALLAIAFAAGMLTEHRQADRSAQARERVLLLATSNYLERSQILLSELAHNGSSRADPQFAREQARDLLNENYLLRESAAYSGNASDAGLLDELERVLLSIANSSASAPDELQTLQQRIENQDLIFKAHIAGIDAQEKGQRL